MLQVCHENKNELSQLEILDILGQELSDFVGGHTNTIASLYVARKEKIK